MLFGKAELPLAKRQTNYSRMKKKDMRILLVERRSEGNERGANHVVKCDSKWMYEWYNDGIKTNSFSSRLLQRSVALRALSPTGPCKYGVERRTDARD